MREEGKRKSTNHGDERTCRTCPAHHCTEENQQCAVPSTVPPFPPPPSLRHPRDSVTPGPLCPPGLPHPASAAAFTSRWRSHPHCCCRPMQVPTATVPIRGRGLPCHAVLFPFRSFVHRYPPYWTPAGGHCACRCAWQPDTEGQPAQRVEAHLLGCHCRRLVVSPPSRPQPGDRRCSSPVFLVARLLRQWPRPPADSHPPLPHIQVPTRLCLSGRLVKSELAAPLPTLATC